MPASIGVNMRVTGHYSQGGRKYMEDKFSVAYQQTEDEKDLEYAYFGIFDGHGGSEAADFAKEHLMDSIVKQRQFWSENDDDVLRAIRNGYMMTHMNMWKELDKWPKTVSGLPSTAGTTASVAFIRGGKIYIGHVGDSAIVLGYQMEGHDSWCAKPLTMDHKPESSHEMSRIHSSGGKVVAKAGVHRVVWNRPAVAPGGVMRCDEIPFLAVARSLGDLWSYNVATDEFVVSPDPDVGVISIDPAKFRCLIFGTDGLWNMVSADAAVQLVQAAERHNERAPPGAPPPDAWLNPSKILVDSALQRWSSTKMRADNTSVVTLIMDPPGPPRNRTQAPPAPVPAPAPHPCSPPIGVPEVEDPCPTSPVPLAPAPEDPTTPPASRGLSIVTRFPDPRPPPPPLPINNTIYTHEEEETFISNYGNPAESYFIARLLNKTQIRNSLQNVYEEITTVDVIRREDAFSVTNNNIEENPFRKTTLLQRPTVPSPKVEVVSQPLDESITVENQPLEDVTTESEKPEEVEENDNNLDASIVQESIQINEVSSSSPVDSPPKRNRKSKTSIGINTSEPKPPVRSLRSHDTPVAPPRPQTRLANRGRPSPTPPQPATRLRHSDSKVPVPVHGKPNPQIEKIVILNRPKMSISPVTKQAIPCEEQKAASKAHKQVPVIAKIKQVEPKLRVVATRIDVDVDTSNNIRVTRSRDNPPSPADMLLKAVRDTGVRKPQNLAADFQQRDVESALKLKDDTRPPIVTRNRNNVTLPVTPRTASTFLRRREPTLDSQEGSKENMLSPSSETSATGPLKSAKRRNSGGGLNDLEPKEKRRTRLDDKRKSDKLTEEQHQDVSSTQHFKDTNTHFMLGLNTVPTTESQHSPSHIPSRRSLRNAEDTHLSNNNTPKSKLRNKKDNKLQGLISDDGASSEVHSTTVSLENELSHTKSDAPLSSRALRSKQDNLQNKKSEETPNDKRSLRSTNCASDIAVSDKDVRPILRSRNSVTALTPRITPRRVKTAWGTNQRQSLRKRCTK